MLLIHKHNAYLIINVHTDDESYVFQAYIPEHLMAEYARWARRQGLMVRRI